MIRPFEHTWQRVEMLDFDSEEDAKQWIKTVGVRTARRPRDRASQHVSFCLPSPRQRVTWKGGSIAVTNEKGGLTKVTGITHSISKKINDRDMFERGRYSNSTVRCSNKKKKAMLGLGIKVDKELKDFAVGRRTYSGLKSKESRSILHLLAEKHITLLDAGVLVSNYIPRSSKDQGFSGTEIDLVGFDHESRHFVIVEVKVTSVDISCLTSKNKRSPLDKTSGFRMSSLGRFAAQLACTTLMFRHIYDCPHSYALLVVCEADTTKCCSLVVNEQLIAAEKFKGWVAGFDKDKQMNKENEMYYSFIAFFFSIHTLSHSCPLPNSSCCLCCIFSFHTCPEWCSAVIIPSVAIIQNLDSPVCSTMSEL